MNKEKLAKEKLVKVRLSYILDITKCILKSIKLNYYLNLATYLNIAIYLKSVK